MENPDFVPYMMSFIKDNDYPLVHGMNPEEMAEVFHISNRCFLVCWSFGLLNQDCYPKTLKGREQDKAFLADLVHGHGFCGNTEKLGFLSGDLSLDEQIKILHTIFKFIERQKTPKTLTETEVVTLNELHALKNVELNLFPGLGEIKSLSKEDKQNKSKEIQKKIESLNLQLEKVNNQQNDLQKVSEINKDNVKKVINDINENLRQFDQRVKLLGREAPMKAGPNYKIDPASADLLQCCNEYLKTITQYTADLKAINEFEIRDIEVPCNEVSPLVGMISEQIQGMEL